MSEKLLPCPFCGETPWELGTDQFAECRPARVVVCSRCGTRGPVGASREAAIAAWNQRPA